MSAGDDRPQPPPTKYVRPKVIPGYGGCQDCGRAVFMVSDDDRRCQPCYAAAGVAPPTTGPYIPWYKTMTPEQMAAIRAARWVTNPKYADANPFGPEE